MRKADIEEIGFDVDYAIGAPTAIVAPVRGTILEIGEFPRKDRIPDDTTDKGYVWRKVTVRGARVLIGGEEQIVQYSHILQTWADYESELKENRKALKQKKEVRT